MRFVYVFVLFLLTVNHTSLMAQHSVARRWNEVLLEAIRHDLARPTVHARNLFHVSAAMYDAWAAYDDVAETYLIGKTVHGFTSEFNGVFVPSAVQAAREEAISFAAYRILTHRFKGSPGSSGSQNRFDTLMTALGYDTTGRSSTDYSIGEPYALGNFIADTYINFGLQDGANEQNSYANLHYEDINDPLFPMFSGNPDIGDPNRWQRLSLEFFEDQSGNIYPENSPDFLSPEWGIVSPFALSEEDLTIYERDGFDYYVYHDPGAPGYFDVENNGINSDNYMWQHTLVAKWSSHLDPEDGVMWDISPASIGNINQNSYPQTLAEFQAFYDEENGGDPSQGHTLNPVTNQPYDAQLVPRGDYTRVLAEFWADGPSSETPPGHWFTILNYVNDHPSLIKKFNGEGDVLSDLEWDIKAYFTLGGTMHDAAVTAWGIKGWYDYIRPISAIRFMADNGQSSDDTEISYHTGGIPLHGGFVEVVKAGDPLEGKFGQHIGKIKLMAWNGPDSIADPETDVAGVGWMLAENWWPYQRPSFVTPPFAGYVSGHSTFSRAAAEVMGLLTGDAFFPGGMGEFEAPKNEFLVFEDGPSVDLTLQWATYIDASEQCSLSRIWGGIHPPVDDIPGRLIGKEIGPDGFYFAKSYFDGTITHVEKTHPEEVVKAIYPNPTQDILHLILAGNEHYNISLYNTRGEEVVKYMNEEPSFSLDVASLSSGLYVLQIKNEHYFSSHKVIIQ